MPKFKSERVFNGKIYELREILPQNGKRVIQGKSRKDRKVEFFVTAGDKTKAKKFWISKGYMVRIVGNKLYARKN